MNGVDWDNRFIKHYVRRDGWLPASIEYCSQIGKPSIKYFTLCDTQAIDIFMLEKAGILKRDPNGKLPNVIICESDPSKLTDINNIVKPPLDEFIINETLEDLLTFKESADVRRREYDPFDVPRNKNERKKRRLKRRHERFKMYLPFDIINFDPSNSILERALNGNRLYEALECFFEFQKLTNQFLLFVTTKISGIHPGILKVFAQDLKDNLCKYPKFYEVMESKFGNVEFSKIPESYRSSVCFLKSIIVRIAKKSGWVIESKGIYTYQNKDGTKWLDSVMFCKLVASGQDESVYIDDIIKVIEGKMRNYSYADSLKDKSIKDDLKEIVAYREIVRKS